jgi:hypothetical protein
MFMENIKEDSYVLLETFEFICSCSSQKAKPLLESNNMKGLVDPSLDVGYDPEEMALTLAVASMCIHHSSSLRPSMRSVSCLHLSVASSAKWHILN